MQGAGFFCRVTGRYKAYDSAVGGMGFPGCLAADSELEMVTNPASGVGVRHEHRMLRTSGRLSTNTERISTI